MTATHVLSLTRRERDILVQWNDGTYTTSVQPAADLERVYAEVNANAARKAYEAAARSQDEDGARFWRRLAMGIDPAPKVRRHVEVIEADAVETARVGA